MEQSQKEKTKYLIFHWMLVLSWVLCIFAFSAQPATDSNSLSLKVTKIVITGAVYVLPLHQDAGAIERLTLKYNGVVRKLAHGTIYFLLGIVVASTFRISGFRGKTVYVLALLFSLVYATSDELHQVLVSGRSGQISDVLLDTGGAGFGIGLYMLFNRKVRRGHKG